MQPLHLTSDVLKTVPQHNYLGFQDEGNSYPEKVVKFLDFDETDVSKATGLPKALVRYDVRIPEELAQRLKEIGNICELVAGYFDGNAQKTALWFQIQNPMLGNMSPRDMIRLGRYKKLLKFVTNALSGVAP